MRYGDLTYLEIKEEIKNGALAVVPTGCTEQQDPHLPVDFDTWFAETVTSAASEHAEKLYGTRSLVLPAMPFGPTPEHKNFGTGYVHVPEQRHEDLMLDILYSLIEQGFKNIVIWRGCGQHDFAGLVEHFNARQGMATVVCPAFPYHDIWCRVADASVPGGHADSFSTSLALYLRPESVRTDALLVPETAPVDWGDPQFDFSRYSSSGVIGDPTHASAELGKRLWEAVVPVVADILHAAAAKP